MIIEGIHTTNIKLIEKHKLKVGDILTLNEKGKEATGRDSVTIEHIHKIYGWLLFKETSKLPQAVKEALKYVEFKAGTYYCGHCYNFTMHDNKGNCENTQEFSK